MPDDQNTPSQPPQPSDDIPVTSNTSSTQTQTVPEIETEPASQATTPLPGQGQTLGQDMQNPAPAPMGAAPKKSFKKWIIGGSIVVVLVLFGGAGALAYNFWYQNPDKVIMDAIVNSFKTSDGTTAKAQVVAEGEGNKITLDMDMKSNSNQAVGTVKVAADIPSAKVSFKDITVDFAADIDKRTGYVKLGNIRETIEKTVDAYVDTMAAQYTALGRPMTPVQIAAAKALAKEKIGPVLNKIENKWIKFEVEKGDAEAEKQQKCVIDTIKKLETDTAMRDELMKAYSDNKFVTVKEKLGSKDGSLGYLLDFDKDKANSFSKAAKETTFTKEINKCDPSSSSSDDSHSSLDSSSSDDLKNTAVEVWVSRWSHQFTGIKVTTETGKSSSPTKVTVDMSMKYGSVNVEMPTDATDYKDLQKDLESAMGGGSPAATPSPLMTSPSLTSPINSI
ncbi:MAG TPA: hypothetical protein VGE34_02305 [Candidatus Saccharimonadales bacterium]